MRGPSRACYSTPALNPCSRIGVLPVTPVLTKPAHSRGEELHLDVWQAPKACKSAWVHQRGHSGMKVVQKCSWHSSKPQKGLLARLKEGRALPCNYFMPAVCLEALAAVLALGSGAEVLMAPAAGPAMPWPCCFGDACTGSPVSFKHQ